MLLRSSAVASFLFLAGCYHATVVDTGLQPSMQTIEKTFASSWIYGLVPPATVDVAEGCEHGAARVETQLSFVNQLVGILTAGIYTPMTITVTCAARPMGSESGTVDDAVSLTGTEMEMRQTITDAIRRSLRAGEPVLLVIE